MAASQTLSYASIALDAVGASSPVTEATSPEIQQTRFPSSPAEDGAESISSDGSGTFPTEPKKDFLYLAVDREMHCRNLTRTQHAAGVMDNGTRQMCELGLAGLRTADLPTFMASSLEEADLGDRCSWLWSTSLVMSHSFVIKEQSHNYFPWVPHLAWCKRSGQVHVRESAARHEEGCHHSYR